MNIFIQAGKLTRDPEVRMVGEHKLVKFGLAVRRRFKGKDGKDVDFFDCEVWRKPAEIVEKYLTKGSYVVVSGELREDKWESADGQKRSKIMLAVENVSLGPNMNAAPSQGDEQPPQSNTGKDEDVPF